MYTPEPQRPVPGLPPTPPHSQKNSMHAQDSTGSLLMRSPTTSPSPREMVTFQRNFVASPDQILTGQPVYPTSISSLSTLHFSDPVIQRRIPQTLQQQLPPQQQYSQSYSQPQLQQPLPPMQMPGIQYSYQQPRSMPQDSAYGSSDNYNRHYGTYNNGYTQQGHPQTPQPPRGSRYGRITASDEARVLLGNVHDGETNPYMMPEHDYEGGHASGKARIVGGQMGVTGMNEFFDRGQR